MIIMEEINGVKVTQYLQGKDDTVKRAIKVQYKLCIKQGSVMVIFVHVTL